MRRNSGDKGKVGELPVLLVSMSSSTNIKPSGGLSATH